MLTGILDDVLTPGPGMTEERAGRRRAPLLPELLWLNDDNVANFIQLIVLGFREHGKLEVGRGGDDLEDKDDGKEDGRKASNGRERCCSGEAAGVSCFAL